MRRLIEIMRMNRICVSATGAAYPNRIPSQSGAVACSGFIYAKSHQYIRYVAGGGKRNPAVALSPTVVSPQEF